ncbi:hypothetical protein fugu_005006 [Takifugu bimaculatus]|uniref:Vacuolar fusion protein MON1 homolog n=1 Tax=Takifugu bimaculatus TaxID=433685 RepID=A0A4Z2B991_9TELE|nr:hypothetical protein fugu_005006 [Takifugu bimaculatus]
MGVMMALVSFVQSGDNIIRSFYSEEHTVVFLHKEPLVLVCVSSSRQSERQLRGELLYVYYQIISMLTQASISRIFEHKKNYDLRRLLAGSEKILDGLLNLVDSDPSFLLAAVHCLPLASSLRDSLSQILQKAITPNLVFSILIARNQLLTIVQEKTVIEDTRLEPADVLLLLNLIGASSAFQAGEIWTPICLPLFNPDCYFYAYISYLDPPECTVCLLLLSTDKEAFYAVAECKRKIEEAMVAQNSLSLIAKVQPYSVSQVGVSGPQTLHVQALRCAGQPPSADSVHQPRDGGTLQQRGGAIATAGPLSVYAQPDPQHVTAPQTHLPRGREGDSAGLGHQ